MQWYLEKALRGKDLSDPKNKQAAANEVLSEVSRIPYAVERDHWVRELAAKLNVDTSVLREDLGRFKKEKGNEKREMRKEKENGLVVKENRRSRIDTLTERLLLIALKFPWSVSISHFPFPISDLPLSTSQYRDLYLRIKEQYNTDGSLDINKLRESFASDNSTENVIDLLLLKADLEYAGFEEKRVKSEIEDIVRQLKEEWLRARRHALQRQIAEAERAGVRDKVESLAREFQSLS